MLLCIQTSRLASARHVARRLQQRCWRRLQCSSGTASPPHAPVLVAEVVAAFHEVRLRTHVDCTLGAGGHALAVAADHPELSTLVGIDVDPEAHSIARPRLEALQQDRAFAFQAVQANFSDLPGLLGRLPGNTLDQGVDGVLMDIGVSSMQLDTAGRGFSFTRDGPLDMRMGPSAQLSAADVVNTWSEHELGRIFRDYGEDKGWRRCAAKVADARMQQPIRTTHDLLAALKLPPTWHGRSAQGKRQAHPATRLFQALRIAVNGELQALEEAIPRVVSVLNPGGRLAIITFHSLEDRIAKRALLAASGAGPADADCIAKRALLASLWEVPADAGFDNEGPLPGAVETPLRQVKMVTRKPIVASPDEQESNPRSRSAKLRVVEKVASG